MQIPTDGTPVSIRPWVAFPDDLTFPSIDVLLNELAALCGPLHGSEIEEARRLMSLEDGEVITGAHVNRVLEQWAPRYGAMFCPRVPVKRGAILDRVGPPISDEHLARAEAVFAAMRLGEIPDHRN